MADTTRSRDLADMLVKTQQDGQETKPTDSPGYFGAPETDTLADTASITGKGPPYYATPVSAGHKPIICGFWSAS